MDEGICDGFDFYFRKGECEPGELMLESDYGLYIATEDKIWEDVKELVILMKDIKEPSVKLLSVIKDLERYIS